jgi:hypothetical protein
MLAKLDNFGPFHFFFTLSCADLRWDENFSAILRQKKDITLRYELGTDEDGNPSSIVYGDYKDKNGITVTKEMRKYLEEEETESLHEYIRGNVLLATRYFNH